MELIDVVMPTKNRGHLGSERPKTIYENVLVRRLIVEDSSSKGDVLKLWTSWIRSMVMLRL
jgi:hypothetical protein